MSDTEAIHRLWNNPQVRRYLWDDEIIPRTQVMSVLAESMRLFNESAYGLWAARFQDGDEVMGFCGYWYFHEPPELQLLYGIAPEYWNKGLATELGQAMLHYGFEQLHFQRITASADAPNVASVRVLEKLGLKFSRRENKNNQDTVFYEISCNEFSALP